MGEQLKETLAAISVGLAIAPILTSPQASVFSTGSTMSTPKVPTLAKCSAETGCSHMAAFIAGATMKGLLADEAGARDACDQVIALAACEFRKTVCGEGRYDDCVSPGPEVDVEDGVAESCPRHPF
eukprot:Plantae.Rhodophyta-Palmaria_palmata.ctg24836.p1 GENE.Plantae.Rhodophyta-Palmaria_palmata.ctg24836~~Plantae.Rhodophyta-Palmaria_palmata.ctg24836.p1  ORF type:complete len:126 (+),score=7.03 Plantae.Rhodophyta-Palmaria_palmata.ctg24836:235-612(+)